MTTNKTSSASKKIKPDAHTSRIIEAKKTQAGSSSARLSSDRRLQEQPGKGGGRPNRVNKWLWLIGLVALAWLAAGLYLIFQAGSAGQSEQKPVAIISAPDYHSLAFSPTSPDTVYFGSHAGLQRSQDGGRQWQPTSLQNQDAMNIGLAKDNRVAYIGGHDVFFKSEDGAQSWRSMLNRLPGTDIHALAVNPANPDRLFAYAVGVGLLRSEDGAQNWQLVSRQLGDSTTALAYDGNTLWGSTFERGVLRSQDGGATWQAASGFANGALESSLRVNTLTYDTASQMLYAGASNGIYRSQDGGSSWTRLGGYNGGVAALAVNPANSRVLLVVNSRGEVYRTEDGGVNWSGRR